MYVRDLNLTRAESGSVPLRRRHDQKISDRDRSLSNYLSRTGRCKIQSHLSLHIGRIPRVSGSVSASRAHCSRAPGRASAVPYPHAAATCCAHPQRTAYLVQDRRKPHHRVQLPAAMYECRHHPSTSHPRRRAPPCALVVAVSRIGPHAKLLCVLPCSPFTSSRCSASFLALPQATSARAAASCGNPGVLRNIYISRLYHHILLTLCSVMTFLLERESTRRPASNKARA